jgi:hypothetical protein
VAKPKVYVDFHNADSQGRVRLNCVGTLEDLGRQQVGLRDGLMLTLYSDDADDQGRLDELLAEGVVSFSPDEQCWVATIDWAAIRHASGAPSVRTGDNFPPAPSVSPGTGPEPGT